MNEQQGWLDAVHFDEHGLIPAIAQDASTQRVLMVAWMNRESLAETARTGRAVYWSRSRGRLWRKGEESGNVQAVREIRLDCDEDVLLLSVEQQGGVACHTGRESCFFQRLDDGQWTKVDPVKVDPSTLYGAASSGSATRTPPAPRTPSVAAPASADAAAAGFRSPALARLADVIDSRKGGDPTKSYVAKLFGKGDDAILKKIGEEATELVMAAKDLGVEVSDARTKRVVSETADLWFHCLVMLSHYGVRPEAVLAELERREGLSGLDEKASREGSIPEGRMPEGSAPEGSGKKESGKQ